MAATLITEHFFAPRNIGEIDSADGIGSAGSVVCGAVLRVSLRVDEARQITAAKFKVAGCSYLVASSSILSAAIIGKSSGEAAALCQKQDEVLTLLGGEWPVEKRDCVTLACNGFVAAIRNYSDAARDEWSGTEALICTCFGVSERAIEKAIQTCGLRTVAEVTKASNAGAGCRSCYPLIEDILEQVAREAESIFDTPR